MWRSIVRHRTATCLTLYFLVSASACATYRGARTDDTSESTPSCVVTEMEWASLSIKQCYLESAPTSLPQDARIPFVATATRTPIGDISNPLTLRVGEEEGRGFVVTLGSPVPPDEATPDPLDELDAIRQGIASRQSSEVPFDVFGDIEGEREAEGSSDESSGDD